MGGGGRAGVGTMGTMGTMGMMGTMGTMGTMGMRARRWLHRRRTCRVMNPPRGAARGQAGPGGAPRLTGLPGGRAHMAKGTSGPRKGPPKPPSWALGRKGLSWAGGKQNGGMCFRRCVW